MTQSALSPFDPESIYYMLWSDAQSEGVQAVPYRMADTRHGAYGVLIGARSPGSNIAGSNHERHPATPTISNNLYNIGQMGR